MNQLQSCNNYRVGSKIIENESGRTIWEKDLGWDEFYLPTIKDDKILARVISDSVCMSIYKGVPADIEKNPVIIDHEFAGVIIEVGSKWRG